MRQLDRDDRSGRSCLTSLNKLIIVAPGERTSKRTANGLAGRSAEHFSRGRTHSEIHTHTLCPLTLAPHITPHQNDSVQKCRTSLHSLINWYRERTWPPLLYRQMVNHTHTQCHGRQIQLQWIDKPLTASLNHVTWQCSRSHQALELSSQPSLAIIRERNRMMEICYSPQRVLNFY